MHSLILFPLLLLSTHLTPSQSQKTENCPLYGPLYAKPTNLSTSTLITTALQNVTSYFTWLDADAAGGGNNSYSIQIFSGSSATPLYEHHHTSSNISQFSASGGTTSVDANTVYRIGSITKLFTMYLFLLSAGDKYLYHPITEFVPELAALVTSQAGMNDIQKVSWDEITIAELASHTAGIAADGYVGELWFNWGANATYIGFPPLNSSQIPTCGYDPQCTRAEFFTDFARYSPAFASGETPAYSNVAFQLIAYAFEEITGKTFATALQESVLTPLGLTKTSYTAPAASLGVIPGTLEKTEWSFEMGEESPAGSIYSSANDLTAFGRAILTASQLTPAQVRRWLKPASLTSDIAETVGYPWGVRRIMLDENNPYNLITSFNKGGSIGSYVSALCLMPELDIGFTILIAGAGNIVSLSLADVLAEILPAVEATAKAEAKTLYAGTYGNSTSNVTIAVDNTRTAGMALNTWFSNGINMITLNSELLTGVVNVTMDATLYSTDLQVVNADGSKQVTFKAIWEYGGILGADMEFDANCGTWIGPSGWVYGGQALDEFVFTINASGKVVSVLNSALRQTLSKN